ncbi:DUF3603 family protein [Virgibacillus sp. W0430]|uniref:DUF3603 family protein n=1 Tax=Virgibacillus sp. W0430 TaxID=3391580 RepID=UPI003F44A42E
MLYLYDVWANWFEGEEHGYNVCYFHEWRKSDRIDLLDQVPLLYITDECFSFIENGMNDLPNDLLNKIHKRAYRRNGQERKEIAYACIVSNGKNSLAFDTIGYQIPVRKSRLIPRQEQLVYGMLKSTKQLDFKFEQKEKEAHNDIISLKQAYVVGLTRRERQLKQLLMMALDQLRTINNLEELRYWLTEWEPKKYPFIRYMDKDKVWNALYHDVKHGWSPRHEELCFQLIKGHPFLENMWEFEQTQKHNTSKLK